MNHRTETEGTLVPLRYLRLVGITLLPENHHDDNGCAGHQQDADDTECHSAGIAGLRQIKTAGIDDFQRNDGICTGPYQFSCDAFDFISIPMGRSYGCNCDAHSH